MANETTQQLRNDDSRNVNTKDDNRTVDSNDPGSTDDGSQNTSVSNSPVLPNQDSNENLAPTEAEIQEAREINYGPGGSAQYYEALEQFDPANTELQTAELWTFNDPELQEHGNF